MHLISEDHKARLAETNVRLIETKTKINQSFDISTLNMHLKRLANEGKKAAKDNVDNKDNLQFDFLGSISWVRVGCPRR